METRRKISPARGNCISKGREIEMNVTWTGNSSKARLNGTEGSKEQKKTKLGR